MKVHIRTPWHSKAPVILGIGFHQPFHIDAYSSTGDMVQAVKFHFVTEMHLLRFEPNLVIHSSHDSAKTVHTWGELKGVARSN